MATNFSNNNISAIKIQDKLYNIRTIPFHGTETEWNSLDYIPKNGEIIIVNLEDGSVRFKIGDGVKTYAQLPFEDEAIRNLINAAETNAKNHANTEIAKVQKELDDYQASNDSAVGAIDTLAKANKATLDAFFDENAVSDAVVNTLKEIQEQLNKGDTGAAAILAELNKIKDGSTTVPKATDAEKLGGAAADDYAKKSDLTDGSVVVQEAKVAQSAESLADTAKEEVKGIKVDNAAAADTATKATQDGNGLVIADTYETKTDANNKLTEAKNHATQLNTAMDTRVKAIEDKPAMGITAEDVADWKEASTIADSAVQDVVGSEGLAATKSGTTVTIGFDEDTVFIFDCGDASGNSKIN